MKNIKSFLLLAICLGISVLTKAQQAKESQTQLAKKEVKTLAPADMNQVTAQKSDPLQADAMMKQGKPTLMQKPASGPDSNLTADQTRTANGTAQKPATTTTRGIKQQPENAKPAIIMAPNQQ